MKSFLQKFDSVFALLMAMFVIAGCSSSQRGIRVSNSWLKLDTVKAGKYDTGTMWTFDYPPLDYFQKNIIFSRLKNG